MEKSKAYTEKKQRKQHKRREMKESSDATFLAVVGSSRERKPWALKMLMSCGHMRGRNSSRISAVADDGKNLCQGDKE